MSARLRFAIFGSSLVSAYWNGAATYYRGIVRGLHERGHQVTFYEPDAYDRQEHRDLDNPDWARVVVYPPTETAALACVRDARNADVVIKASGVGVHDALLELAVLSLRGRGRLVGFLDVDAPATLDRMRDDPTDPFRSLIPLYDFIFTYGGGDPVVRAYTALDARLCVPVYNALDPATHHPVAPDPRFVADLAFLGNRLPDREARVDEFFLKCAALEPRRIYLLGGSGWEDKHVPSSVRKLGHVPTEWHNALNATPIAVLNVSRDSMARYGFSPATRVFEAAGAGACIITDAWEGIEHFLEPGREILVAANGEEVAAHLRLLDSAAGRAMGMAARARVLAHHTYAQRAEQIEAILTGDDTPLRARGSEILHADAPEGSGAAFPP